jgi:four helix bundle protein
MRDLIPRTKKFAVDVILFTRTLKDRPEENIVRRQLIRAATSTAAHYRAAQRSKSRADFLNKINGGLEEADESGFWLEIIRDTDMAPKEKVAPLLKEAGELTAILCAIARNTKRKGVRQSRK